MATFAERADLSIRLEGLTSVAHCKTHVQKVELYKHPDLGLVLIIDGEVHHVEAWQAAYHEPLVHLAASFVPTPITALILGGGDLFAAREILKYPSIRNVVLVEHDRSVIDLVATHYAHARKVLEDSRLDIRILDAARFAATAHSRYDLVINDWLDLALQGSRKKNFYLSLEKLLTRDGVCTDVLYRHVFNRIATRRSLLKLKTCSRLVLSLVVVPEYPGVFHIQAIWGSNQRLRQEATNIENRFQKSLTRRRGLLPFEYYDPRYRAFFLYVPPYIRAAIDSAL